MSNRYEIAGTVKEIGDTQTFASGFTKREFVITTDENYPQDVKLEVIKDKCDMIDSLHVGESVTVHFNIRGNEHNGRYYVNLQAWKIDTQGATSTATAPPPPIVTTEPMHTQAAQNAVVDQAAEDMELPLEEDNMPF